MLLHDKKTDAMIEVMDLEALISPAKDTVPAKIQEGQEEQNPESFEKSNLLFPSGESLPRCWVDPNYRLSN